jgi:hypothetical protein
VERYFQKLKGKAGLTDRQILQLGLLILAAVILVGVMSRYLPRTVDWHGAFRPATLAALAGRTPYDTPGYVYPPWTVIPLIPIAILPEQTSQAALLIVSLGAFLFAAYRLGATRVTAFLFLLSPPIIHGLLNGNIDWLVILGFVLPPQIGLFLVTIKPQMGFGVAVYWLVEIWRENGLKEVIRVFWPVTLSTLASFVLFGLWPLRSSSALTESGNSSLWPLSIPVGLALLVAALRERKSGYAMGAAPCLSPFVNFHSWSGALIAIVPRVPETIAAVAGLWILILIRAILGG